MSGGFGRLLGGLVGAFVGSFVGNPALGFSLGSSLFGSLFAEDQTETVEGPRLDDLSVQTSSYGKPLPIVYGGYRLSGNVLWMENNQITETKNVNTVEQGKGGPSKSQTQITYTYSASFAVSMCEGEIDGVRRIWADTVLVLDNSDDVDPNNLYNGAILSEGENVVTASSSVASENTEFGRVTIYKGTKTQRPHPRIQADRPDTPAYRNTAYLVFEDLQLERFGNRLPQISIEVVKGGTPQLIKAFQLANAFEARGKQVEEGVIRQIENITTPGTPTNALGTFAYYEVGTYRLNDGVEIGRERVPLYLLKQEDDKPVIRKVINNIHILSSIPDRSTYDIENGWILDGMVAERFIMEPLDQKESEFQGSAEDIARTLASAPIENSVEVNGYLYGFSEYQPVDGDTNENFLGKWRNPTNPVLATGAILSSQLHAYVDAEDPDYVSALNGDNLDDNTILVNNDGRLFAVKSGVIIEIDPEDLSIIQSWEGTNSKLRSFALFGDLALVIDSTAAHSSQDRAVVFRLNNDGTVTHIGDGPNVTVGAGCTKVSSRLALCGDQLIAIGPFFGQEGIALSTVIDDLCGRANVDNPDVSQLTETLRGYAVTKPMSINSAINGLRPAFRFDGIENGYQMQFKPRELTSVRTLTEADLGVIEPGQDSVIISEEAEPDVFLPRRVRVQYHDINRNYERGAQYAGRIVTSSEEIKDVNIAVVMDADEAVKTADIILKEDWARRRTFSFNVSMEHFDLLPADVVTLQLENQTVDVRIQEIDDGQPGIRKCSGARDGAFIYSSNSAGETGSSIQTETPSNPGPSDLVLLDIPLLRDQDDNTGLYLAVGQMLPDWIGANVYEAKPDNSYENIETFFQSAIVGSTNNLLADAGSTTTWDDTIELIVSIPQGDLESKTELEVLNGANVAAVSCANGWEIIQFANVVDNGDGTFTLSHLLRGRLGTEWATNQHSVGDRFALMVNDNSVRRYKKAVSDIGEAFSFKAVSFGSYLTNASAKALEFKSVGQKPWSPVHIEGTRDGSDNLTIDWIRRARFGGGWRNGLDVPNTELTESYEIDILDGNGDVVRTLTSSTPTVDYTASQQNTDFGSVQSSIDVRIYQMSDVVGRGYAGEATL